MNTLLSGSAEAHLALAASRYGVGFHSACSTRIVCQALRHKPMKRWRALVRAQQDQQQQPMQAQLFDVPTKEARDSLRLELLPEGRGQAIVVAEVARGSAAEQLGIRPGMKLLAVSDPVRYTEMWRLEDRPSMRIVGDLMRLRVSGSITMEFEQRDLAEFGMGPNGRPLAAAPASTGTQAMAGTSIPGSIVSSDNEKLGAAAAAVQQQMNVPQPAPPGVMTMAEKLARQYQVQAEGVQEVALTQPRGNVAEASTGSISDQLVQESESLQRLQTESMKRMARRQERLELDDRRDDTGFFLGVAAAFLLPALVILVIAYGTGYLDRLYDNTLFFTG